MGWGFNPLLLPLPWASAVPPEKWDNERNYFYGLMKVPGAGPG